MKLFIFICLAFYLFSCAEKPKTDSIMVSKPQWHALLEENKVKGTVVVFDYNENTFYSNDFERAQKGFLPASTFKIFNTMAGLQSGVVDTSFVFTWDGSKRQLPQWERDMTLIQAFHLSCVPCYQEIARRVGAKQMRNYLQSTSYGHMIVNEENIDVFWLQGESHISPMEQISFLIKLYRGNLTPFSPETISLMKKIMISETTPEYVLRAKTGWAIRQGNNTGWYVGYVEKGEKIWFFATNVEPMISTDQFNFTQARIDVTMQVLREMGVI